MFWSSAAAVGDPDWLAHTAGQIGMRRFETTEGAGDDGFDLKTFFLSAKNYSVKSMPKPSVLFII